ncbi:MAG: acylneuraminate cytidylyltransferase family protein [Bacteroidaceae bacterium]|nr:acylneuraminate cytidylyltransferase family protein [Bacteroidaceae bacterium]
MDSLLVVIPARGGSKGLPGKNIRNLCGKPLICHSIDVARAITSDDNICVSTDSREIIDVVEQYNLKVPFLRPAEFATDSATTNDVLLHAISYYENHGRHYKQILLLQPTSPLRTVNQVREAISMCRDDIDMVVSVTKSHAPSVLCMDNEEGFVELVYNKQALGRQNLPVSYEFNGAIYVINVQNLKEKGLGGFTRRVKYVMPKESSIDIDDIYDFMLAENILKNAN